MFPVADDFAEIARRLKEIQAEVTKERETAEAAPMAASECQPDPWTMCDDMAACA